MRKRALYDVENLGISKILETEYDGIGNLSDRGSGRILLDLSSCTCYFLCFPIITQIILCSYRYTIFTTFIFPTGVCV